MGVRDCVSQWQSYEDKTEYVFKKEVTLLINWQNRLKAKKEYSLTDSPVSLSGEDMRQGPLPVRSLLEIRLPSDVSA